MPFRNLIFDLDGTLVDSLAGIEASIAYAVERCAPGQLIPPIREQIGPPIAVMLARLYPEFPAARVDEMVKAFREHYDDSGCRQSVLYPGVAETLSLLSGEGVAMFVLTNKPLRATQTILEHTGIARFFIDVVSPDKVQPAFKSKAAGAISLAEQYQLDPQTTAVIGDGLDDASAASACGFAFVLAGYGYGSAAAAGGAGASVVLKSFDEILRRPDKVHTL